MKLAPQTRFGQVRADMVDAEDRTIEISFSSEAPVDRWFGREVLVHGRKNARLDRLNDGAPILFNHNMDDLRGVVEKAWIGPDKKGMARIRLANNEDGQKALDLINDRVLRNISFMYRIHEIEKVRDDDGELDEVRVTDWEALEISLVTIAADPTVGIGRGELAGAGMVRQFSVDSLEVKTAIAKEDEMKDTETPTAGAESAKRDSNNSKESTRVEVLRTGPDQEELRRIEEQRQQKIREYCGKNKIDERFARSWIENGADLNEVADGILSIISQRNAQRPESGGFLDLSKTDVRRYSVLRALRAAINQDWKQAGLELEANNEIAKKLNRVPRSEKSFFVPLDVMMKDLLPGVRQAVPVDGTQQRDMTVAGVSGSNYLVSTDNYPGSFIDLLRNSSVALRMGVQRLSGLQGNVTIPKMTAGNTAYWLSDETTQITESQPTIGQLSLSPKNVAALTELSHQLMQQSTPDAENLVLQSIARDIGLAVDVGVLRGSGSAGQPTGIATTGSIGAFTGTSLASPGVLNAISDVGTANALMPGCGFATTPAVAALLMDRPELSSTGTTRLWKGNPTQGSIFDYPAMASAQMSAATMLFGWWPSVILAEWGVLELMVNPFSDFTRGLTAVRGWYTCDVGVRYAGAWSYASSIT